MLAMIKFACSLFGQHHLLHALKAKNRNVAKVKKLKKRRESEKKRRESEKNAANMPVSTAKLAKPTKIILAIGLGHLPRAGRTHGMVFP